MSQPNPTRSTPSSLKSVSRRQFVKQAGAAGLALSAGGGLGLFGGKAPAFAQARTVHVLAWSHFIKEADELMRGKLAREFKKSTGVSLKYETINANNINARATAAVESGQGPDILQLQWNQPHLYAGGLENHDSLATELGAGKHYAFLQESATVDGVFRGMPFYGIGNAIAYRKDIFQEVGIKQLPTTWEDYLKVGKKLKNFGMPIGQTLGHTFGDAPTFAYPLLWSYGGRELDEQGKVAINTNETVFACEFLREFWNEACDETGLAWDDSSNNRAFFAETIGATLNGASIYFVARNNPEKAPPGMANKIGHLLNPTGTHSVDGGKRPTPFHSILPFSHCITRSSKQKDPAKDFIRFVMQQKNYENYIVTQKGYGLGATKDWEDHRFWKQDPVVEPFRLNARYGRNFGYAGPFGRGASEVQAKYIIVDLFARVARGDSSGSSIAQAERELKQVYGG